MSNTNKTRKRKKIEWEESEYSMDEDSSSEEDYEPNLKQRICNDKYLIRRLTNSIAIPFKPIQNSEDSFYLLRNLLFQILEFHSTHSSSLKNVFQLAQNAVREKNEYMDMAVYCLIKNHYSSEFHLFNTHLKNAQDHYFSKWMWYFEMSKKWKYASPNVFSLEIWNHVFDFLPFEESLKHGCRLFYHLNQVRHKIIVPFGGKTNWQNNAFYMLKHASAKEMDLDKMLNQIFDLSARMQYLIQPNHSFSNYKTFCDLNYYWNMDYFRMYQGGYKISIVYSSFTLMNNWFEANLNCDYFAIRWENVLMDQKFLKQKQLFNTCIQTIITERTLLSQFAKHNVCFSNVMTLVLEFDLIDRILLSIPSPKQMKSLFPKVKTIYYVDDSVKNGDDDLLPYKKENLNIFRISGTKIPNYNQWMTHRI